MVPKPGEPGSETWPDDGEAWQRGGGNCWVTSTFDPELNLLYWGPATRVPTSTETSAWATTSTPIPAWPSTPTPARSRRTSSTPRTTCGTTTPRWSTSCSTSTGRSWPPTSTRTGSCTSSTAPTWSAVRVAPFVDRIDWGEVDEKGNVTPKVYPDKEGDPVHFWPGPAGAKEWTHACYNPNTELLYCPGAGRRRDGHAAAAGVQGEHPVLGRGRRRGPRRHGGLHQRLRPAHRQGGVALAQRHPDVLVAADDGRRPRVRRRADGRVQRAQRRDRRAAVAVPVRQRAPRSPCSYSIDGRQYIAVPTGWGAWTEGFLPGMLGAGQGSSLFVFALPED